MFQEGPKKLAESSVDIKHCIHEIETLKEKLSTNRLLEIPVIMQASYQSKETLCYPGRKHIDLTKINHVIFFAQGADNECTVPKEYMEELLVPYHRYKKSFVSLSAMIAELEASIKTLSTEERMTKMTMLQTEFIIEFPKLKINKDILCHFLSESATKRKDHGRHAAPYCDGGDCFLNQKELMNDFIEYAKSCIIENPSCMEKNLKKAFVQFFEYLLLVSQGKADLGVKGLDQIRAERARIFIEDCGGPKSIDAMIKKDSSKAVYGPLSSVTLKVAMHCAVEEIEKFRISEQNRLMKLEHDKAPPEQLSDPDSDPEPTELVIEEVRMDFREEPEGESDSSKFRIKRIKLT